MRFRRNRGYGYRNIRFDLRIYNDWTLETNEGKKAKENWRSIMNSKILKDVRRLQNDIYDMEVLAKEYVSLVDKAIKNKDVEPDQASGYAGRMRSLITALNLAYKGLESLNRVRM